jgi:subtilase family serine protease
MSQSFGIPEVFIHNNNAQVLQANKNYSAAQAARITVFASSGDTGATFGFSTAMANFPASHPLNTGVGGTMGNPYIPLGTNDFCASGQTCSTGLVTVMGRAPNGCTLGRTVPPNCIPVGYGGEQVWNEPFFGVATGGAPSLLFGVPSYQSGLGLTARTTPDISYNGSINGGVLVTYSALGTPLLFIVGGTSAGSPQWAAIGALANQYSAKHGHGPLGFINPALYQLAESGSYGNDFHDITVGNNRLVGTPVGFNAAPGYDAASGWGTPNVANLIPDLVNTVYP